MTEAPRRNRTWYDGDLRARLVEAAVDLVAEVGPARLSLREVARRVGVSHAAPKNHFADKRALLTAIAAQAHRRLAASLDAAADRPGGDPLDTLVGIGGAYLRFAREQGAWYAVMWQEDLQDRDDPELVAAAASTFAPVLAAAGALVGPAGPAEDLAALAWAWVHGLADLSASGALRDLPGGDDPQAQQGRLLAMLGTLLGGAQPSASSAIAAARAAATAPEPGATVASTVAPS